jgi:hypothetical protein
MTNITAEVIMVIFVIRLFMIVPLRNDSNHALFSRLFSRLLKLTHLVSGQSIAAVMYDDCRAYFGIYKIVLLL